MPLSKIYVISSTSGGWPSPKWRRFQRPCSTPCNSSSKSHQGKVQSAHNLRQVIYFRPPVQSNRTNRRRYLWAKFQIRNPTCAAYIWQRKWGVLNLTSIAPIKFCYRSRWVSPTVWSPDQSCNSAQLAQHLKIRCSLNKPMSLNFTPTRYFINWWFTFAHLARTYSAFTNWAYRIMLDWCDRLVCLPNLHYCLILV